MKSFTNITTCIAVLVLFITITFTGCKKEEVTTNTFEEILENPIKNNSKLQTESGSEFQMVLEVSDAFSGFEQEPTNEQNYDDLFCMYLIKGIHGNDCDGFNSAIICAYCPPMDCPDPLQILVLDDYCTYDVMRIFPDCKEEFWGVQCEIKGDWVN